MLMKVKNLRTTGTDSIPNHPEIWRTPFMPDRDDSPRTQGRSRFVLPLLAGGMLAVHLAYLWGWTIEDVFILFRWVRNVAEGAGFVFNPGERIEGYSNFFYLLLLAGFHRLGIPGFSVSSVLGVLSAMGVFVALWVSVDRQPLARTPVRYLGLFFLALSSSFCLYAVSGLETVPYALMLFVSLQLFWAEFSGRIKTPVSWLVMIPAVLCRPEAPMILVAGGMSLALWAVFLSGRLDRFLGGWLSFPGDREREAWIQAVSPSGKISFRTPGISLLVSAAALILYALWKVSYFGELLPNTFYLKATGSPILQWMWGLKYSLLFFIIQFNVFSLVLLVPLVRLREHLHLLPHLFILLGYGFFNVYCGGDWMPLYRFYVPVIPSAILLIASGSSRLVLGSRLRGNVVKGAFCASLLLLLGHELFVKVDGDYTIRDMMAQTRAQVHTKCFYELGGWMKEHLPASTNMASAEAGIIPYLTNFYYLDMKGYIDKQISRMDCPIPIWCKYDNDYILGREPDCIVLNVIDEPDGTMKGLFPWADELLKKEKFQREYRRVHAVKRGMEPYRVSTLCLFCRNETPVKSVP